jgi:hypothetical protein
MSPPRLISTPRPLISAAASAARSTARAFAVAPKSSSIPAGTHTVSVWWSKAMAFH